MAFPLRFPLNQESLPGVQTLN